MKKKGKKRIDNSIRITEEQKKHIINSITQRKEVFDILGIRLMEDKDLSIAKKMISLIPNVFPKVYPMGNILSEDQAFSKSYKYLSVFGQSYVDRAAETINSTKVNKIFNNTFTFVTNITYEVDHKTNKVIKESGNVNNIKTPIVFDEVSPMWLAHEHIHNLKELNYEEYKDGQIFGDVIPMFLELVIAGQESKDKSSAFIMNRLYLLKNEVYELLHVKKLIPENNPLYKTLESSYLQYLNSFYYSLQLYELYKTKREETLDKIREVLDGEKTTRNILEELELLHNFDKTNTKKALQKVISIIK